MTRISALPQWRRTILSKWRRRHLRMSVFGHRLEEKRANNSSSGTDGAISRGSNEASPHLLRLAPDPLRGVSTLISPGGANESIVFLRRRGGDEGNAARSGALLRANGVVVTPSEALQPAVAVVKRESTEPRLRSERVDVTGSVTIDAACAVDGRLRLGRILLPAAAPVVDGGEARRELEADADNDRVAFLHVVKRRDNEGRRECVNEKLHDDGGSNTFLPRGFTYLL